MIEIRHDMDHNRFVAETAPFDTIELCGSACDRFVAVGAMEATYECLPAG